MRRLIPILFCLALLAVSGCNFGAGPAATNPPAGSPMVAAPGCTLGNGQTITMASEVKYEDLQICGGTQAQAGNTVTINYIALVKDGNSLRSFQNTYDNNQPYTFKIGTGQPLGLDQGVIGMAVGSKRRLTLNPTLGYGLSGDSSRSVPPNATLLYVVEMMTIKP